MTNLHVPVWGYIIMGMGLAAFIFLLVKYILRNRGLKRPIFASPYILWIVIFTVVPCLLVAYYAFTKTENVPRYSYTLQGHKAEQTKMLNPDESGQNIEFSPIQYAAEDIGVHAYTITVVDHLQGSSNENKTYAFVVSVEDDQKGSVKVQWEQNYTDFRKSATADNQLVFKATRPQMPGEEEGTQYSYTLSGENVQETILCGTDGTIAFSPIPYTHEDIGTHQYTIAESKITAAGEVISLGVYTYKVDVSAKDENSLKIKAPQPLDPAFRDTKANKNAITFKGKTKLTLDELKMSSTVFSLDNFREFFDSNYSARKVADATNENLQMITQANSDTIDTLIFSLWMAFLCTVICLLLGYPAAHIMADREFKLGPTLVILFVVPMWMNFLLRTIALMNLMEDNGLINNILEWMGIGRQKLLNNNMAIQIGMVYNFLPFMVFPIYNALNKMDYKLSEAAMDLGCNKWKTFYKVTLPLSLPGVVSGITMVFMPAVTTFYISRLLGGGKVQLFGDLIEAKFLSSKLTDWNVGSAMSLVMMILILLSLGLLQKVDPDGEGGGMV